MKVESSFRRDESFCFELLEYLQTKHEAVGGEEPYTRGGTEVSRCSDM